MLGSRWASDRELRLPSNFLKFWFTGDTFIPSGNICRANLGVLAYDFKFSKDNNTTIRKREQTAQWLTKS